MCARPTISPQARAAAKHLSLGIVFESLAFDLVTVRGHVYHHAGSDEGPPSSGDEKLHAVSLAE